MPVVSDIEMPQNRRIREPAGGNDNSTNQPLLFAFVSFSLKFLLSTFLTEMVQPKSRRNDGRS